MTTHWDLIQQARDTQRRRFGSFSDEDIADIARAFGSAANESERVNDSLATELAAEFVHRGQRIPLPYEWGESDPDVWWSRVAL